MGYFIIAGKEEGFDYKNAKILKVSSSLDAESVVNSLRGDGYVVIYVSKIETRIDDIVGRIDEGSE